MNHLQIAEKLFQNKFEVYYVGGYVRDFILNKKSNDVDVCTNATPQDIIKLFNNVKLVGERFKVCIIDGIEVATFRKDIYFGLNSKNCEIKFANSIEEDLMRRDFTINAIAMEYKTNKIIDPYNGISDIKNGILTFVGNSRNRIYQDPNRILRAIRFKNNLGFKLSKETEDAILTYRILVKYYVDKERILIEIMKALKTRKSSSFFYDLQKYGILKYIFPSLTRCYNLDGGMHHNETVFEHCLDSVDYISPRCKLLRLASLLHDAGKYEAAEFKDGNTTFYNHHSKIDEIEKDLKNLKLSNRKIEYIITLIQTHMHCCDSVSSKSVRKLISKLNEKRISNRDWIKLRLADTRANRKNNILTFNELKNVIRKFDDISSEQTLAINEKTLAINGKDVMEILNLPQCKQVGDILRDIYSRYSNEEFDNEREVLLEIVKEYRSK